MQTAKVQAEPRRQSLPNRKTRARNAKENAKTFRMPMRNRRCSINFQLLTKKMSQFHQTSATVSNPDTVMRMISTTRPRPARSPQPSRPPKLRLHTGDESLVSKEAEASTRSVESSQTNSTRRTSTSHRKPSTVELHLATETAPTADELSSSKVGSAKLAANDSNSSHSFASFALAGPPTPQVQQLVDHLHQQQKKLAQREADLQAEVYHWDKQVLASKAALKKRAAELEQHLTQVEQQQSLLVKLQQNLIDSQTAIRATVERLIEHSDAAELKSELLNLQLELGQRFDEILNRWERVSQWHQVKEKICYEAAADATPTCSG